MKKLLSVFIVMMLITRVAAQECWLLPDKFIYERGEPVNIGFRIGENFEGGNWTGDTSRVKSLRFYYGDVKDDLRPAMGFEKGDSIQFSVLDEGTVMVTYSSKNWFIESDSTGGERFEYCSKTIFQIGNESNSLPDQETGLPLDILLQQNPYNISDSQMITATVVFQNEPLENTLVKIWHRENDTTSQQEIQTDENGAIRFQVAASGAWMLTCVKMNYRASCTWGYR